MINYSRANYVCLAVLVVSVTWCWAQLPQDLEQELNKGLEEEARRQALLQQQRQLQQQQQQRLQLHQPVQKSPPAAATIASGAPQPQPQSQLSSAPAAPASQAPPPPIDPNNFSFNQVSPPIMYSFYRPFGEDQSQAQQPQAQSQSANQQQPNYGWNTGQAADPRAGGGNYHQQVIGGQPGVQQGPPMTERDFNDVIDGANYGAPPGSDFGLGNMQLGNPQQQQQQQQQSQPSSFGNSVFPFMSQGLGDQQGGYNQRQQPQRRLGNAGGQLPMFPGLDAFGDVGGFGNDPMMPQQFAALAGPSVSNAVGNQQPEAAAASQSNNVDDGAIDIGDLGDTADRYGGTPTVGGRPMDDFNFAAASENQPELVPYPDEAPQPVGTLWALTQPGSMTQPRHSALIDKGTYHGYPAYSVGSFDGRSVADVVDSTPEARPPGPGRYGWRIGRD